MRKFYRILLHAALRRPKIASEVLYWHLVGRQWRARHRLRDSLQHPPQAYRDWIARIEKRPESQAKVAREWTNWPLRPRISVLLYQAPGESGASVERRMAALESQIYGEWEIVLAQSREASHIRIPSVPRLTMLPTRTDNPAKALTPRGHSSM